MRNDFACAILRPWPHLAFPRPRGELKLTIKDGLVTVVATDVPLSQILAGVGELGQTKIVNGEKLTPLSVFELVDVPEKQGLDIILRRRADHARGGRRRRQASAVRPDPDPAVQPVAGIFAVTLRSVPAPFVNRPVMATPEPEMRRNRCRPPPPDAGDQPVPQTMPQQPVCMPQPMRQPASSRR